MSFELYTLRGFYNSTTLDLINNPETYITTQNAYQSAMDGKL